MKIQSKKHRLQSIEHRLQNPPSPPFAKGGIKGSLCSGFCVLNSKKGFTLIEVLIALTILAIGLLGVALMQVTSISGNTFSREMSVATELGQDMLEKLRTLQYTSTTTDPALTAVTHPIAADVAANLAPAISSNANNIIDERGLWTARATALGTSAGPVLYTRIWTVIDGGSPNCLLPVSMKCISVTVSWTEKGVVSTNRSITITGVKVRS